MWQILAVDVAFGGNGNFNHGDSAELLMASKTYYTPCFYDLLSKILSIFHSHQLAVR